MAAAATTINRPLRNDPACKRCPLHQRSETVCCETTNQGKRGGLFLVGEALGAQEERIGRPFVGDAGHKLNYLLARAKLNRKELSIGNACNCRPPGNKQPTKTQVDACYPYLWYDILKLRPKVIVALGSIAYQALLSDFALQPKGGLKRKPGKKTVSSWRGFYETRTFRWESPKGKVLEHTCIVVPTFHPSAALRNWEKDDLIVFDFRLARMLMAGKQPLRWPETQLEVATTFHQALALLKRLRRIGRYVLDLETTGLNPHTSRVLCAGFCWKEGHAAILPLRSQGDKPFWRPTEFRQIVAELTETLEQSQLIGQNIKFDLGHLRKLTGLVDIPVADDTALLHHCLDENKPHNLTFLCQWFLRWLRYDSALDPYKVKVGRKEVPIMADAPNELLWTYCGHDVNGCYQLLRKLKPRISKERLQQTYKIELDLTHPLADLEYRGINADTEKLDQLSRVYKKQAAGLERKLQHTVSGAIGVIRNKKGEKVLFNPRSAQQMGQVLKALGADLYKKTPAGQPSVDKHVLAGLAQKKNKAGRFAKNVTALRKAEKIVSTYLDGTKEEEGGFKQHLVNGRWHSTYNIFISRTGRLSADDPAIQTTPRAADLRSMVIPDQDEHRIIAADYEKLELCVMSWLANDGVMVKELEQGLDLHTRSAVTARLMRTPTEEEYERIGPLITKDERTVMGKCFHPDTEVLTRNGWKRILDLEEGEEVIQAVPGMKGEVVFQWVVPEEVFSMENEYDHLLHFQNNGIDIKVTPDHGMLVWKGTERDPWQRITAEKFVEQKFRYWVNGGWLEPDLIKKASRRISEVMLRLAVATQADGHYCANGISFKFTKKRKALRLAELLRELKQSNSHTKWSAHCRRINNKDGWTFRICRYTADRIKALLDGKAFPWWWLELSEESRRVVLEEAVLWDSHKAEHWRHYAYSNTDEQSVDVLQALASVTGLKAMKKFLGRKEKHHSVSYKLSVKDHCHTRSGNVSCLRVSYDGVVVCLTVPSRCVLVRGGSRKSKQIPIVVQNSVNFGIPYGRGAGAIVDANPDRFPLGMTKKEKKAKVQKAIDSWLGKYYKIAEWREGQVERMARDSALRTCIFKRLRRLTGVRWFNSKWGMKTEKRDMDLGHMEREAMNFEVQSIASMMLNRKTKVVYDGIKKVRLPGLRIIMSLHDALIFSCHQDYTEDAEHWIKRWMQTTLPQTRRHKYEMPLKVEVLEQAYWGAEYSED